MLEIKIDQRTINRLSRRFPTRIKAMVGRASKETGTAVRKDLVREIRLNLLKLKSGDLKRRNIDLKRQTSSGLPGAIITISGARVPLRYFNARQTTRGISYSIKPSSGRKRIRDAFLSTMNGGLKTGVFARAGKKRLPINELLGPSVPHALEHDIEVLAKVTRDGSKTFEKKLAQRVAYELSKQ